MMGRKMRLAKIERREWRTDKIGKKMKRIGMGNRRGVKEEKERGKGKKKEGDRNMMGREMGVRKGEKEERGEQTGLVER